jgi:hypothetical protein
MAINKAHDEFHTLDMSSGWETPAGYPAGIQQKMAHFTGRSSPRVAAF